MAESSVCLEGILREGSMMAEALRPNQVCIDGLAGKTVAVVGLGKSGCAAAQLLQFIGAHVVLVDHKVESELVESLAPFHGKEFKIFSGKKFSRGLEVADLVVVSPGVPISLPAIQTVLHRKIPVIGEIELASWFLSVPIVAVTGTNGKSTVVSLIGRIFEESSYSVFVGGNLGTPLSELALDIYQKRVLSAGASVPLDMVLVEVSSFQLETIKYFHPHVAVVLNLTADHLDWHPSLADYAAAKTRIFENQNTQDFAVLNDDDSQLIPFKSSIRGKLFGFSMGHRLSNGVYCEDQSIVAAMDGRKNQVMPIKDIALLGKHNIANVLAAVTVGLLYKCPIEAIRKAVGSFKGVEHALEVVRLRHGVMFVNDSKATNSDATIKALESFKEPAVVILGGKDKGMDFSKLREPLKRRAKQIVLIGEAAERIAASLGEARNMCFAPSLQEAVRMSEEFADPGDVVLLSPACASFDMFQNYRDRGQQFRHIVNRLPE